MSNADAMVASAAWLGHLSCHYYCCEATIDGNIVMLLNFSTSDTAHFTGPPVSLKSSAGYKKKKRQQKQNENEKTEERK